MFAVEMNCGVCFERHRDDVEVGYGDVVEEAVGVESESLSDFTDISVVIDDQSGSGVANVDGPVVLGVNEVGYLDEVSAELPLPLEPVPDAVGEVGDNKAEDKAEDEEKIDNEDDGSDFPGVYKDQDDDEDPHNIFIPMNGNFPEDEDDGSYDDSNQA
ncbi:hypothetical protein M758_6G210300, partial [Ceratodon purpureus]